MAVGRLGLLGAFSTFSTFSAFSTLDSGLPSSPLLVFLPRPEEVKEEVEVPRPEEVEVASPEVMEVPSPTAEGVKEEVEEVREELTLFLPPSSAFT